MKVLTTTFLSDLKFTLDTQTITNFSLRYSDELHKQSQIVCDQKMKTADIQTPSTIETTFKRGSAITKARLCQRPNTKSKDKMKQTLRTTQVSIGKWAPNTTNYQKQAEQQQASRKTIADRAVYYGNVDLPYLHSSDAIASLYQKKRDNSNNNEPLLNPSANISPHLLAGVKNLYLYYTSIDSVRQLGTGWSNLKSLTIMCSRQLKDLSGLSIFPSLQHLFVPFNEISQISDIMYHSTLKSIDLHGNQLDMMQQIQFIYTICNLQWVDVSNNPITEQRQKYRIIRENLGDKMQTENYERLEKYVLEQMELDQQFYSYQKIQNSNSLIKSINQQVISDAIELGSVWKNYGVYRMCNDTIDIQIIDDVCLDSDSSKSQEEEFQQEIAEEHINHVRDIQLRVTPLVTYLQDQLDLTPLKKYFYNKVSVQSKPDQRQGQSARIKQPIINEEKMGRRLGVTQSFNRQISQDNKLRLTSSSQKKKLGRLSLPKNSLKFSSSQLESNKQQNPTNGVKFIGKRKLFGTFSQNKFT